jgi:hypothetical protein
MKFIKIILALCLTIGMASTYASSERSNLSISPIIGFERVQQMLPTPTMKTRAIFGAQALYKLPVAALEAEYTHGQNTNDDAGTNTSYKYTDDKLKLGLRGGFGIGQFLSSHLSGGAQATQSKVTKTVNSTTSTSETTTKVNPYVGTGIAVHLLNTFTLSADITVVYKPTSTQGLSDFEYQPALGIGISF